jgi:hypothetical protein
LKLICVAQAGNRLKEEGIIISNYAERRKRQRLKKQLHKKEEMLQMKNYWGKLDPTPYEAVKDLVYSTFERSDQYGRL